MIPPPAALQVAMPRLVLASASASRRGLLEAAGLRFAAVAAAVDEAAIKRAARAEGLDPAAAALRLADAKALAVAGGDPEALVIGADQLLVHEDGRWFDKPPDLAAARAQLLALRGHADRLARALAGVVNLLDPEVIVLGGGLSNMAHLYEALPRLMPRHVFGDVARTPVRRAAHGDSSGVLGAARLWDGADEAVPPPARP